MRKFLYFCEASGSSPESLTLPPSIDITGVGVPSQITYGGWIKFHNLPSENSRAQTLVALNDDGAPANSGAWGWLKN
jgi:hypothetical protein